MLDSLWLRGVLEQEGLEGWRVLETPPGKVAAECRHDERVILLPRSADIDLALEEIAHALCRDYDLHDLQWVAQFRRLVRTHTFPVCKGTMGLEG